MSVAGQTGGLLSILEDNQGWNTANVQLGANSLFCLGIELCQPHPGLQLACRLLECRGHHFTGTAPRRPEINNHRDIVPGDMLLKSI
jgi:hypothetical protein